MLLYHIFCIVGMFGIGWDSVGILLVSYISMFVMVLGMYDILVVGCIPFVSLVAGLDACLVLRMFVLGVRVCVYERVLPL